MLLKKMLGRFRRRDLPSFQEMLERESVRLASDVEFVEYIQGVQRKLEEGTITMNEMIAAEYKVTEQYLKYHEYHKKTRA